MYLVTIKISEISEMNLRVFLGEEYECPRGHRFFCSGPEKIIKVSSSSTVKVGEFLVCLGIYAESSDWVLVSLNILSLRFSLVPYSLYGTYKNIRLKMFSETGTWFRHCREKK